MMFAILALVGWFPDPSWLILRGFGWQIKAEMCQTNANMGTRSSKFGRPYVELESYMPTVSTYFCSVLNQAFVSGSTRGLS